MKSKLSDKPHPHQQYLKLKPCDQKSFLVIMVGWKIWWTRVTGHEISNPLISKQSTERECSVWWSRVFRQEGRAVKVD